MQLGRPRIFITQTQFTPQVWGGGDLSARVRELYLQGTNRPFALVGSANDADVVVFWEEYQEAEGVFAPKLRQEALALRDPEKAFVVTTEDRPIGFLPGVYASTPLAPWNDHRFRSGCWPGTINPHIVEAAKDRGREPRLLYCFTGAATAEVRRKLFQVLKNGSNCHIEETRNLQFNVCVDDPAKAPGQKAYLETMLDSRFVLCPRGYGTSSFRLFETMQLGRVPVILSDPWVPPRGPAWQDFSIRVAESRVGELGAILENYAARSAEMGQLARAEWEQWFTPDVVPYRSLEWIWDLYLSRPHRERDYFVQWDEWVKQARGERSLVHRVRHKLQRMLQGNK